MKITRRAALLALAAAPAAAHHGFMQWDYENPVFIEGWVSKGLDGFPHWEIWVRVDGKDWEVDVGDQFVLQKAGLSGDGKEFRMRREIRVEGYRPVDKSVLRILPRRIIFEGGDEAYDIVVEG